MENKQKLVPMSASRIKTAKECSWKYYYKYILKLPEKTNSGALMGGIVHNVLEYVFNDEGRTKFNDCVSNGSADNKEIRTMVSKEATDKGVNSDKEIAHMLTMIDNALRFDFYGEARGKPLIARSELAFDFEKESPFGEFRILGFIDQIFIYEDNHALVRDFKTSKKVFAGADAEDNLQDSMYSYASRELFSETSTSNTEFLFLKFDLATEGCLKMPAISSHEFIGLEAELAGWQQAIQKFDLIAAESSMAAHKNFPTDGSFTGPLMCGFAKYPGQLKIDGTPMFYCPAKFPFDFYCIVENGVRIKSAFADELESLKLELKEGQTIKKFKYNGCPAHQKLIDRLPQV